MLGFSKLISKQLGQIGNFLLQPFKFDKRVMLTFVLVLVPFVCNAIYVIKKY
jgi:hypothetical protein